MSGMAGSKYAGGGTRCKVCKRTMEACRLDLSPCSKCEQAIVKCVEDAHQQSIFCQAHGAALAPTRKGFIRCPDAVASMCEEVGAPFEVHPSGLPIGGGDQIQNHAAFAAKIRNEVWAPPEVLAIIQVDRSLEERKVALRRFAEWYADEHALRAVG